MKFKLYQNISYKNRIIPNNNISVALSVLIDICPIIIIITRSHSIAPVDYSLNWTVTGLVVPKWPIGMSNWIILVSMLLIDGRVVVCVHCPVSGGTANERKRIRNPETGPLNYEC